MNAEDLVTTFKPGKGGACYAIAKTIGLNANFGLTEPNRMIWPDFYIPNVTVFVFATI